MGLSRPALAEIPANGLLATISGDGTVPKSTPQPVCSLRRGLPSSFSLASRMVSSRDSVRTSCSS